MRRVFIVHGYTGYPNSNWFPWLRDELEDLGVTTIIPSMPNTNMPELVKWLPHLQQEIGESNEDTYLVGHSLGCPTILRYLEALPEGQKVGGVLLVAGFAEPIKNLPELNSFTIGAWDDEKIKRSTDKIAAIHSDDDPSVPYEMAENLRDRFNAELTTLHRAGHINAKGGFTEVPFVLDKLKEMMNI